MMSYKLPKIVLPLSIVGTVVGGSILLKEYAGGRRYSEGDRIDGKTVIITGSNTGIGKETARELAKRGARVIMACRDMKKCEEARKEIVLETQNKQVVARNLDLASLTSVRQFAQQIIETETRIDILINNGGVMQCPHMLTQDGFEMQLGVNHLGHFLLTNLLLTKLKESAPSRIVTLSSIAHTRGKINFEDLNSEKNYSPKEAYNQSKLANLLFSMELSRRLEGTKVTSNAVHPGIVFTEIGRHLGIYKSISFTILKPLLWLLLKTPRQGAQTSIYCSLSPELENISGKYFSNCQEAAPSSEALNKAEAERLWLISEKWTRLSENETLAKSMI